MRYASLVALAIIPLSQACRDSSAQTAGMTVAQAPTRSAAPQAGDLAGRFVSHVDNIQPGGMAVPIGMVLRNPYEGSASAIATGAKLFVAYNCMDCHGADGSGAMGPSLADGRWHFGGTPAEVYESIYQEIGRAHV